MNNMNVIKIDIQMINALVFIILIMQTCFHILNEIQTISHKKPFYLFIIKKIEPE